MPKCSIDDGMTVKERLRLGDSIRERARRMGVDRGDVFKWSHMGCPPDRMVLTMDIPDNPATCARMSRSWSFAFLEPNRDGDTG